MSRAKREQVKFRGLITNPNELESAGDGGFRTFTNCVLTRPNLAQSRRGYTRHATNGACVNKLFNYDGSAVFHSGTASLKKLVAGVISAYSGSIAPSGTGRLRGCISGKNFYVAGTVVSRLSGIGSTPTAAGGLFSPGFDASKTVLAAGAVLATDRAVAYRSVFGFTDPKGYTHLGEPSGRLIVINTTGQTVKPTIRAVVPSTATANHFIQFYRSATTEAVASVYNPDDDLQLVFEQQLKALDITNGYVDLTDVVPQGLRGAIIYIAPNGGEGELQANLTPPGCVEVCHHLDRMWWGNTTRAPEFTLNILAVGGTAGIQNGDSLKFGGLVSPFTLTAKADKAAALARSGTTVTVTSVAHGYSNGDSVMIYPGSADFGIGPWTVGAAAADTFTYTEAGSAVALATQAVNIVPTAGQYTLRVTLGDAATQIEGSSLNLVGAFNKYATNTELWAKYISGPTVVPGQLFFKGRTAGVPAFNVVAGVSSKRSCFSPKLQPDLSGVSFTLVKSAGIGFVTATINTGTHSLEVGEQVLISPGGVGSGGSLFGTGPYTITGPTTPSTTFEYTDTSTMTNGTLAGQVATLYVTDVSASELEVKPNRVYYSKLGEYEASTREGWLDVGSADTAILAMKSQRGQIWVWKTTGIYRILGSTEEDFRVEALDTSINIRSTESIVLFANRCWGLTDRGVVAVSESGMEVMSGNIENDLRTRMAAQVAILERDTFAVAYESEGLYIIFVPPSVDAQSVTGACQLAYVYRKPSQDQDIPGAWSLWDFGDRNGKRCAMVGATDDLMYLGDQYNGLATDSYIYQERKAFTTADLVDTTGANVATAITQTMTWLLQTERAPSHEKRWDELAFLFVSGQAAFTLTLANEVNSISPVTIASQANQQARAWIPLEVARGTRLLVTISHAVANEAFDLAGLSVLSEVFEGGTGT